MGTKIDTPTDISFIDTVVINTECTKHVAPKWVPCWYVQSATRRKSLPAVCNDRALKAGLNGKIDPRSMSMPPKRQKQVA